MITLGQEDCGDSTDREGTLPRAGAGSLGLDCKGPGEMGGQYSLSSTPQETFGSGQGLALREQAGVGILLWPAGDSTSLTRKGRSWRGKNVCPRKRGCSVRNSQNSFQGGNH